MLGIIVEDEFLARRELKYYIENFSDIEIVGEFEDGLDVFKFMQQEIDVIFLDINISSLDGMALAKIISKFSKKPYIVFITAYKEYAIEAFDIEAFDYILKPYEESRIVSMLKKLQDTYNKTKIKEKYNKDSVSRKINLWKNEKFMVIDLEQVCYCVARERITYVVTKDDEYSVNMGIAEFHNTLPKSQFFKCHRSYIVNINKIKEIVPSFNNTYDLKLEDIDYIVPVSRSKSKEFKVLINV
jgi:two-component system LytT family response regulator